MLIEFPTRSNNGMSYKYSLEAPLRKYSTESKLNNNALQNEVVSFLYKDVRLKQGNEA